MIDAPPTLGQLMLQSSLATSRQLEVALASQHRRGGRIGSWLVRGAGLDRDLVARTLAEQHGVLAASGALLGRISEAALGAVQRGFCAAHFVLPMWIDQGTLHLAMRDPARMELIDRVGRTIGCAVQPYAIAEVELFEQLERHYNISCPRHYRRPPVAAAVPIERPEPTRPAEPAEDDLQLVFLDEARAVTGPAHPAFGQLPTAGGDSGDGLDTVDIDIDIDIDLDEISAEDLSGDAFDIDVDLAAGEASDSGEAATLEEVLAALCGEVDRETVLAQLLRPTVPAISLIVVLRPRERLAVALGAWGTSLSSEQVRQLRLPLSTPSLLQEAHEGRCLARGPADRDPLQTMIANYLEGKPPAEALVAPVCIKDKVVNLLCVQTASAFDDDVESHVTATAQHAGAAYARAILQRKQRR